MIGRLGTSWLTTAILIAAALAALVPAFTGLGSKYPPLDSRWPLSIVVTAALALVATVLIWRTERQRKVRERTRSTVTTCLIVTACLAVAAGNWVPFVNGRFDTGAPQPVLAKVIEVEVVRGQRQLVRVELPSGRLETQLDPRWQRTSEGTHQAQVKPGFLGIRWLAAID